jgi:Viral alkaline exonuclease
LSTKFSELRSNGICVAEPTRVDPITNEEFEEFLGMLSTSKEPCALLRICPAYSVRFKPKELQVQLPKPLSTIYNSSFIGKSIEELIDCAERHLHSYDVTPIQAERIEELTRAQNRSRLWFQLRQGRITASLLQEVVRSDPRNPRRSLLQRICYPFDSKFSSEATR